MTSHSNAVLASDQSDTETCTSSLCLASDVRGYSTTPTAHVRDLVADGITGNGLAVYFAIADRQVYKSGEYFRSNESLAEETGLKVRTVQSWISKLRKKQYLHVWYINGGRRMRISTKVQAVAPPHATSDTPPCTQLHPYKENNIKKTTQQQKVCVSSISLSKKHSSSFGEGGIRKLVAAFGIERVERGLLAWDAEDHMKIRNPIAWLTRAVKDDYEPRTAQRVGRAFPKSSFEHDRIIKEYIQEHGKEKCLDLSANGLPRERIAYKIFVGKI